MVAITLVTPVACYGVILPLSICVFAHLNRSDFGTSNFISPKTNVILHYHYLTKFYKMKKIEFVLFFFGTFVIINLFIVIKVTAQKLPSKQDVSVNAPSNVKIDGKSTEWAFQAYNKATSLYYVIANDSNNLYLSIQASDPLIIQKIISAGIKFTISDLMKKDNSHQISISYPVIDNKNKFNINLKNIPEIVPGSEISIKKADSFMNANNNRLNEKSKFIMVKGIKELDTLISVYNDDGIKAISQFDNKMVYTYEMSLNFNYLKKIIIDGDKFFYNIMINEVTLDNINGLTITTASDGLPFFHFDKGFVAPHGTNVNAFNAATDFSGEYTLAKKP